MKKIISFLYVFLLFANHVYAEDTSSYVNKQKVIISQEEYNNLKSNGFTTSEIETLDKFTIEKNKNLKGKVLLQNEYLQNNISRNIQNGYIETEYKKITTTITEFSNFFRYKISVEWKKMPYYRSYDIIGIGKNSNVSINGNINFVQNYCYKNGECSSSYDFYSNYGDNGFGALFQLAPSKNVNSIIITLFYNVKKSNESNTITRLDAYGDYKHATKNISLKNAKKFSVQGELGIELEQSISSYYDNISIAHAFKTGSW